MKNLTTRGPQYAHIGGELSSLKDQVQTLEYDLAEFENVNKRYKDQLIKVKVGTFELIDAISGQYSRRP
jgi:hypothetical protein